LPTHHEIRHGENSSPADKAGDEAPLAVIIPNFNGRRVLDECLASLARQTVSPREVIVVDNGSTDGSAEHVRRRHPGVVVLELPENRGFSAAVNAGIGAATAPLLFLLNNDTELAPDCLAQLAAAASSRTDCQVFAAKMLSYHQRHLLDGAGDGYLRGGAGYRLGTMEEDGPLFGRPGRVFGACAGAALYRRELFSRIGFFDEDFFAYLEDVDFNLRACRAGCVCHYVPAARVFHLGSATSGSKINAFTVRLSTRNSLCVLLKHYSLALVLRWLPVILLYQLAWLLLTVKKGQLGAWCAGLREFLALWPCMRAKRAGLRELSVLTEGEFAQARWCRESGSVHVVR